MSELHIECPHCGASFDVQIEGDVSSMMVFSCAKCQTPLMYYSGEISELDRKEFTDLREKLSKVLKVVMKNDNSVSDVVNSLKRLVNISNERAIQRESEQKIFITDEDIEKLKQDLDKMDAESFLNNL